MMIRRKHLVANCRMLDLDLFAPENTVTLENMKRIASCVRVSRVARIRLTNFFSVEATLVFSIPNSKEVYLTISFLRNEDFL